MDIIENIKRRIKSNDDFFKFILNVSWLIFEKCGLLALSLITSILMARYLGVNDFGSFSYALALYSIFSSLTYLGLNSIVSRELISTPNLENKIMGSAFYLKLLMAIIACLSVLVITEFYISDEKTSSILNVMTLGLFFESFSVISFWFLSHSKAKNIAIASVLSTLFSSSIKILFVLYEKPLIWFGYATAFQALFLAVLLISFYYYHNGRMSSWKPSFKTSISLLKQSWPLAMSALFSLIYLKIDQVMIGSLLTPYDLGGYAAAAKLSEAWYALPVAIATGAFPIIVKKWKENRQSHFYFIEKLYSLVFYASIIILVPVVLMANEIIVLLYGNQFVSASNVLAIHILACPAVFMGAVLSKSLIAEGLVKFMLFRDIFGGVINVLLNLVMIPKYGVEGAAIATVISYTIISYITTMFYSKTRQHGVLMSRAVLLPFIKIKSTWCK